MCFLNSIRLGVAFEKPDYFEELFLMKKDCTKKLNYEVADMVKSSLLLAFSYKYNSEQKQFS